MKFVCGTCDYTQLGDTIPSCGQCGTPMHPLAMPVARPAEELNHFLLAAYEPAPVLYVSTGSCLDILGGLDSPGIPLGAMLSLSGGPGVGKTITALRAAAGWVSFGGGLVRYLTAEESVASLKRLAIEHKIYDDVFGRRVTTSPTSPPYDGETLWVVDSLQRYRLHEHDDLTPGTARYLIEVVRTFRLAQPLGRSTVLLLGQVTKNDTQAGPRAIEHDVDIVARLRRLKNSHLRELVVTKNRFGPVGRFPAS